MNKESFKKIVEEELIAYLENASSLLEKKKSTGNTKSKGSGDKYSGPVPGDPDFGQQDSRTGQDGYRHIPNINKPPENTMTSNSLTVMRNLASKWANDPAKVKKFKDKFPGFVFIRDKPIPRWRSYMWSAAGVAARAKASKGARLPKAAPKIDPKTKRAVGQRVDKDGNVVDAPTNAVPVSFNLSAIKTAKKSDIGQGQSRANIIKRIDQVARNISKLQGVTVDDKGKVKIPALTLGRGVKKPDLKSIEKTLQRIGADAVGQKENSEIRDKIKKELMKIFDKRQGETDATKTSKAAAAAAGPPPSGDEAPKTASDVDRDREVYRREREAYRRRQQQRSGTTAPSSKLSPQDMGFESEDEYKDITKYHDDRVASSDDSKVTSSDSADKAKEIYNNLKDYQKSQTDMFKKRGGSEFKFPQFVQKFMDSQERQTEESYQAGNFKITNSETDIDNKNALKLKKIMSVLEASTPTNPEKWAGAVASAKKRFDVYPSAYANLWAAKKYKQMGGKWRLKK